MKSPRIFRDKDALEIMRNIIRDTMLGNGACALLISLARPMFNYSLPVILFALMLIVAAVIVFLWMAFLVLLYFGELEDKYPRISKTVMFFWTIIFEISVMVALWHVIPSSSLQG